MHNHNPTNLILNAGTLGALLIALVVGGFVAADLYNIVQEIKVQNKANGNTVNQTLSQILDLQKTNNIRGNNSIMLFKSLILNQINQTNQTNTLLKFLVDNFGEESGYLDRENFQYGQANDTLKFLKQSLINQQKGLDNQAIMIKNQEIIKKNQEKIINQTR